MDVANEILDAIEIIVDKKIKEQTTQIYPGICKSVNGNSCVMSINGKDNTVQFYGSAPIVGTIYRVFVPYGNMSMAFIITANDNGSSASGVSSVNGLTGDVNLTASDVGAAPAGYGLGGNAAAPTTNDANSCTLTGWYAISSMSNCPFTYGLLRVEKWYDGCIFQTAYEMGSGVVVQRRYQNSEWKPWEWVNPPMLLGVEYRTTERYDGKVVTRKLVNCGAIANRKTVQLADNNKYRIISANVRLGSDPIPYWHNGAVGTGNATNVWNAYFSFGGAAITLYCGDSAAEAAQTVLAEVRMIPA